MNEILGLCIAVLFVTICLAVLYVNQKRLRLEIKRVDWSGYELQETLNERQAMLNELIATLNTIKSEIEALPRIQSYRDLYDSMPSDVSNPEEEMELPDDVFPIADTEKSEEESKLFEDMSEEENDNFQAYATLFLRECPLTQKFKVARINDDIAEVMRIMLYDSGISTSSYVNNILSEHFKEYHTILERKSREVAASLIEASL